METYLLAHAVDPEVWFYLQCDTCKWESDAELDTLELENQFWPHEHPTRILSFEIHYGACLIPQCEWTTEDGSFDYQQIDELCKEHNREIHGVET